MADRVWRMTFVGGDWDGREQLVPDVGNRPQGRFLAPFLDGVSIYLSAERPTERIPYVACLLARPGTDETGWIYATPDLMRRWAAQGYVDDEAFDLMAKDLEEVP